MSTAPITDSRDILMARADALVEAQDGFLDALVELRGKHGYTQQQVADAIGVSQTAISKFESEGSNPTLATLRRYALAVGARFELRVVDDCVGQAHSEWEVLETRTTAPETFIPAPRMPISVHHKWDESRTDLRAALVAE